MKTGFAALLAFGCLFSGGAVAQSEDVRWVNQCVRDSAGYAVSQEVKTMYCACMVSKMDDKEGRSVTQWEKANPGAATDCATRAGWK